MFEPSKEDVRRFFCTTWKKFQDREVLTPMESIAARWMAEHPEYHDDLRQSEEALNKDYSVASGRSNPFLHLSMHLSIEEQVSIDQPKGIRAAFELLSRQHDSSHQAMHEIMECLAEALWQAQRSQTPLDAPAYIKAVQKRAQG